MRTQYPETMTIVLQHQFWDLDVGDDAFEVGLSFGGAPELLKIPFDAVTAFYDPAVQFGFQFETIEAGTASERGADAKPPQISVVPVKEVSTEPSNRDALPAPSADESAEPRSPPDGGMRGEVVRLDRFRKK
jgi:hypothetical protein